MPKYDHLRTESVRDLQRMQGRGKPAAEVVAPYPRPRVRADCAHVPRPCPFAGCRYNLAVDVTERHALRYRAGSFVAEMPEGVPSCALDVAAQGPQSLQAVADVLDLKRTRVAKIERDALAKLAMICEEIT